VFDGSLQYTDKSRTTVARKDANAYTGRNTFDHVVGSAHTYIEGTRRTEVGGSATATTRGASEYTPADTGAFTLPGVVTNATYVDRETIDGSRRRKVRDLLVEDIHGDQV